MSNIVSDDLGFVVPADAAIFGAVVEVRKTPNHDFTSLAHTTSTELFLKESEFERRWNEDQTAGRK